jgi:glycosyltransferase involved in cell wall biosynthesis
VVSNRNPWTGLFLEDGENCLLSDDSATRLADLLEEALLNEDLRQKIVNSASQVILKDHQDWDREFEQLFTWMKMRRE